MKIIKNEKALSPVTVAIILIVGTIVASTAVATWMAAPTLLFTGAEQLKIANVQFEDGDQIIITVKNTGTTPVTVTRVHIGYDVTNLLSSSTTIPANNQTDLTVNYPWANGGNYQIEVVTSKGNQLYYIATAPIS